MDRWVSPAQEKSERGGGGRVKTAPKRGGRGGEDWRGLKLSSLGFAFNGEKKIARDTGIDKRGQKNEGN